LSRKRDGLALVPSPHRLPPRARARSEALAIVRRVHLAGRRQFGVGRDSIANLSSTPAGRDLDEMVLKAGAESIAEAERLRQRFEAEHAARFRQWWSHWIAPDLERLAELAGGEVAPEGSVRWCLGHHHWIPAGQETCDGGEGLELEREKAVASLVGVITAAVLCAVLGFAADRPVTIGPERGPLFRPPERGSVGRVVTEPGPIVPGVRLLLEHDKIPAGGHDAAALAPCFTGEALAGVNDRGAAPERDEERAEDDNAAELPERN
jgi:hypothetical protein